MGPRLDTGGWLTLTGDHYWFPPDRDFHPARYAELSWTLAPSLVLRLAPLFNHASATGIYRCS